MTLPSAETIRTARADNPKMRERDLAASLGISEAALVAAHVGHGVTRISPVPGRLIPLVDSLGEVLALTRNESAVHERVGRYTDFTDGPHAAMLTGPDIDLRIFPSRWVHGFAVEKPTAEGIRRSVQVFDAHGDAVHKVHLRPASDVAAFDRLVAELREEEQADTLSVTPRPPVEGPKADPSKADRLREEWLRMTDTHQFLSLTRKLKMNRLGAYRTVGAPQAVRLADDAVTVTLKAASASKTGVMVFVGNEGCIQIHSGPVDNIVAMGPWINVLDPLFDLHLRTDHVAEVWLVDKPTRHGKAVSVEAFDREGYLILQIFGRRGEENARAWETLVATLPRAETVTA
ncbi:hemin-degrading factor [Haematobacter genomosp. 1]|uniref:Hemin-degrading factor n=1 Tax=Haematobacter genomosp. 1 TaxID=366618 RepID=A0A212AD92_9RHOB|nr:ChuX/HutX family heme-like substrate-binding protein [Haematobacter genomosp. 1]OWJ78935.1 hemin-degrading factor [Haematobacter genomosp. 1]